VARVGAAEGEPEVLVYGLLHERTGAPRVAIVIDCATPLLEIAQLVFLRANNGTAYSTRHSALSGQPGNYPQKALRFEFALYDGSIECMAVSQSDKRFMSRLGAIKAASHREASRTHRALPPAERLRRSWELFLDGRSTASAIDNDDPSPFYDRARALGLYRP
jgi:hypothetical protein